VASLLFFHLFLPAISRPDEYGLLTAGMRGATGPNGVLYLRACGVCTGLRWGWGGIYASVSAFISLSLSVRVCVREYPQLSLSLSLYVWLKSGRVIRGGGGVGAALPCGADQLTPAAKRNVYLLSLAMRGVAKRSKADPNSGEEWFLGPVDDAVMAASDNLIAYVATMCGVRHTHIHTLSLSLRACVCVCQTECERVEGVRR
jgi:hypothetical protein